MQASFTHNSKWEEAGTWQKTFEWSETGENGVAGFVDNFLHLNLEMFGVSELFSAPGLTMVVEQNVSCSDVVQHATQAGGNLGGTRK